MKTLFTGFSPNTRAVDVRQALAYVVLPWKWFRLRKGNKTEEVEQKLETMFEGHRAITFDSGRSALLVGLKALGIKKGDEVLVQAFTCVVVINAIKWAGATPIYVDIEPDSLNMDPADAKKKVTSQTKAIIIQHTFGLPADLDSLLEIAREHNLKTVEDCAHSLGAMYKGRLTGTFGDVAMLSFGGEKIVSCVRGGALITRDVELAKNIEEQHGALPHMSVRSILQHLMHVILFPLGKKFYHVFIGKLLLKVSKSLRITHRIIESSEKKGIQVPGYPAKLPNALASLLLNQFETMTEVSAHRKEIAKLYSQALAKSGIETQQESDDHSYLRYAVFVDDSDHVRAKAKEQRVLLGDWYNPVIGPGDTDMTKTQYSIGSCPVAEKRSMQVVNLPTNIHISAQDARRIVASVIE